jgi:hypothetical protein
MESARIQIHHDGHENDNEKRDQILPDDRHPSSVDVTKTSSVFNVESVYVITC